MTRPTVDNRGCCRACGQHVREHDGRKCPAGQAPRVRGGNYPIPRGCGCTGSVADHDRSRPTAA
jgi:hypothetical protein